MNTNRYTMAGWLSIAIAVIFPLNFVLGIIQNVVGQRMFEVRGPMIGPSDLLSLITMTLLIYVFYMFRKLLNERYNFHDCDMLITLLIWWNIVFTVIGIFLKLAFMVLAPASESVAIIIFATYFVWAMTTGGIIDIIFAVRLLRIKDSLSDLLKVFAYITIASGIAQVTVILSPIALIMIPVWCVILGMVFLREKEEEIFV